MLPAETFDRAPFGTCYLCGGRLKMLDYIERTTDPIPNSKRKVHIRRTDQTQSKGERTRFSQQTAHCLNIRENCFTPTTYFVIFARRSMFRGEPDRLMIFGGWSLPRSQTTDDKQGSKAKAMDCQSHCAAGCFTYTVDFLSGI